MSVFSHSRLRKLTAARWEQGTLEKLLANEALLALGCFVLGMVANIVFVLTLALSIEDKSPGSIALACAIAVFALLVLAGIVPKSLANKSPERVVAAALPALNAVFRPISPLTSRLNLVARFLERRSNGSAGTSPSEIAEEISSAVSDADSVIAETEKEMIRGIIEFRDADVAEVMTPRTDMFSIEASSSLDKASQMTIVEGHSRVPIFEKNRDNIIGVLYVKDLLKHWGKSDTEKLTVRDIMRQPYFVPETKQIRQLLKEFQKAKVHIAIVLDEYGGTAGLITLEDIIEEVVGEIVDEYDTDEEIPEITVKDGVGEVDSRVHIDEVNEALAISLPEDDDYDTVGGFAFSSMGRVPSIGESFIHDNVRITVLDADQRHIKRLRIEVLPEDEAESND